MNKHLGSSRASALFSAFLNSALLLVLCVASHAEPVVRSVQVGASALIPRSQPDQNTILVWIDSAGLSNVTVRLTSTTWGEPKTQQVARIAPGRQSVAFNSTVLANPVPVNVSIEAVDGRKDFGPFTVTPPRKWTVYLAQHTHTDIGYTRPQTEILPEHLRYIDYALDYCDQTDRYPEDAKFRWTCETSWAVREYLKGRPPEQVNRLKKRVKEGRIEICGLMLNMSEIAPESAIRALLRPLQLLKNEHGLDVRTAMQNDVNGAAWCLPDYFSNLGIRYLTMGINQTRSILPFDKPTTFWWESPSGRRVLAYRADHYHLGNFWHIHEGQSDKFKPGLDDYLRSLEQRAFPYDHISVQFSGYHTDNSPPSTAACDLVKQWNERYAWPKLRLSTSQEFLAYVEKEHSRNLPVHRQAWPDWWTDGFGSAARETAAARQMEAAMQVNYGLLAMARMLGAEISPATLERAAAVQDQLLFYHEHTYGAAESIDDPLAENTQVQWGEKASYVWSAVMNSHLLREEAFGLVQDRVPRQDVPTLAVFNTLNWPRSSLVRVFVDHEVIRPDRQAKVLDAGELVPAQPMERRSEGTYWAFWVRDVPPLGYKVLRIENSDEPRREPAKLEQSGELENRFYKIVADPERGGLKSLIDKETGQELIDQECPWRLDECVYETQPNRGNMKPDSFKRVGLRNTKFKPGANGPVWRSLWLEGELDGCATNNGVRAEIRLYETEKRIELHFDVRKLAVRSPESIYVALPFRMPEGRILYEAQGGMVIPGDDQIPGSSSDWQTLQNFIAVRGPQAQVVTGSEGAPLAQLGDFNLGKWQRVTKVEKPHIYSWVMNNYWFTNFRTEQEGEFKWHYYLTSTRDLSRAFSTRFGWGSRVPLATRVLPAAPGTASRAPLSFSLLTANVPNVLLVDARPSGTGKGIVLHVREVEGLAQTVVEPSDVTGGVEIRGVDEVDAIENVVEAGLERVTLRAFESKFLRLALP